MRLFARFLKPHIREVLLIVVLTTIDVCCMLQVPRLTAEILNLGTSGLNRDVLISLGGGMLGCALLAGVAAIASVYVASRVSAELGADIRCALYEKSMKLSVYDFRQFGVASITTRTIPNVTVLQTGFIQAVRMMLPTPIYFLVSIVLTFSINQFFGWLLVATVVAMVIVTYFISRYAQPFFKLIQRQLDKIGEVLLENLSGVRVLRAFNMQKYENDRLNNTFEDYAVTSIKVCFMYSNLDGISYCANNLFIIIIYLFAPGMIADGVLRIGDITAVVEYSVLLLFSLVLAQIVIMEMPRAFECARRICEVLDFDVEIEDSVSISSAIEPKSDKAVLELSNVCFRYKEAEEDTLQDINFRCMPNTTTAIIGGTGSGKSTIASLIMRFNDISAGDIKFEDVNIFDMSQEDLRKRIGYVQQKAWLAQGTIRENLLWGNEDATEEELTEALKIAQAYDFVMQLDGGLDARVEQSGRNFSGGQRQRLSIARALVKSPLLYVFDDSFSALDFATDAALRRELNAKRKSTKIIIAQRVSTIMSADQIVVLDEGAQVGLGTHEELMKTCSVYKEIVESQTREVTK